MLFNIYHTEPSKAWFGYLLTTLLCTTLTTVMTSNMNGHHCCSTDNEKSTCNIQLLSVYPEV